MRRTLQQLPALLLLAASLALAQQTQPVPFTYTQTVSSTSNPVWVAATGQSWATVRWNFDPVLVATLQPQCTTDGINWTNAPYSKRLDATSSNPTVAATVSPSSAGQTWETPLPGNVIAFRLNPTSWTTAGYVTVYSGLVYVPGVPVVAVLYDVTSGTNAALDTGTLDLSGWTTVQHAMSANGGTPAFAIQEVDDTGTNLGNIVTYANASGFFGGMGPGLTIGGTAVMGAATASVPLPRRAHYTSAAIVSQTSRIRVVARR